MYASITTALVLPKGAVYEGTTIYDVGTKVALAGDTIPVYYNHDATKEIGRVLAVFEKPDGLYAVLAIYEQFRDKIQCDELVCRGADGWSIGADFYDNTLVLHEISLTPTPYFDETFKNVEVVLSKEQRFMINKVEACGCGKPIKPHRGIISNMVKAQDLEQVLVEVQALQDKVTQMAASLEEIKATLDGHETRLQKLEAMLTDVPTTMEAHKKTIAELTKAVDETMNKQVTALLDAVKQLTPVITGLKNR